MPDEKHKRPLSAKVIGKVYKVQYVTGAPLNQEDFGECDDEKQQISIADGLPLENEQDTFLHECIHALDAQMSIGLKEAQVSKLATGLLSWMKDNSKPLTYLRRKK